MSSNNINKKNTFGKSLDLMMDHHRRVLAQSTAMIQRLQQQLEEPHRSNLHFHRHHQQPSLASALAAWQSQLFQHHSRGLSFPKPQAATAIIAVAPTELAENDTSIRLTIDLPGVYKKDLKVHVERGNVLTVQAVRRTFSVSGQVCIKKQRIARSFAIDTTVVNLAQVSVTLNNGVLTIQAPKWTSAEAETKQQQQQNEVVAQSANIVPDNDDENDEDVKTKVSFDSLDIDQTSSSSRTWNNDAKTIKNNFSSTFIAPTDD
jgi:HSP20 family molecular chaperone IbpA